MSVYLYFTYQPIGTWTMPESLLFAAILLVQGKSDEHLSSFFPPRFFPTLMVRADHYSFFFIFFLLSTLA